MNDKKESTEKFLDVDLVKKLIESYCTDNIGSVIDIVFINDLLTMIEDTIPSLTSMENPCKSIPVNEGVSLKFTLKKPNFSNDNLSPEDICSPCPKSCGANTESCFKTCEIIKNSTVKNIIIRRINETMVGDFLNDLEADKIVKFIDNFLIHVNEEYGVDVNVKYKDSENFGTAINTVTNDLVFGITPAINKGRGDGEMIQPYFIPLVDVVQDFNNTLSKSFKL